MTYAFGRCGRLHSAVTRPGRLDVPVRGTRAERPGMIGAKSRTPNTHALSPPSKERKLHEQAAARRGRGIWREEVGRGMLQHRVDLHPAVVAARAFRRLQIALS